MSDEQRRLGFCAATKRWYDKNPEKVKAKIERQRIKNLATRAAKAELRALIKAQQPIVEPKSYYVPRTPKEKLCPICGIAFVGRTDKIYCKRSCSPTTKEAKRLRKRLKDGGSKRKPKWQPRAELVAFYEACPEGWHVDHVIPLNHELVSGLHCISNLQYLSPEDNMRKSNKFDGTEVNEGWRLL